MKTRLILPLAGAFALAFFVTGCATTPAESREAMLAGAGFRSATASTAQEKTLLRQLPANQISKVQRNSEIWFVLPNSGAETAMVGTQAQYTAYLQRASSAHVQPVPLTPSLQTPVFRGRGGTLWGTQAQATRIRRPATS